MLGIKQIDILKLLMNLIGKNIVIQLYIAAKIDFMK